MMKLLYRAPAQIMFPISSDEKPLSKTLLRLLLTADDRRQMTSHPTQPEFLSVDGFQRQSRRNETALEHPRATEKEKGCQAKKKKKKKKYSTP
jgi:hypothetical protein